MYTNGYRCTDGLRGIMRELMRYLRPYGGKVALAMGMIAVSTFCNLMLPTIMSRIVTAGVYTADFRTIIR